MFHEINLCFKITNSCFVFSYLFQKANPSFKNGFVFYKGKFVFYSRQIRVYKYKSEFYICILKSKFVFLKVNFCFVICVFKRKSVLYKTNLCSFITDS